MESILTKSIIAAGLTFLITLSGILLRRNGEPYKPLVSIMHETSVVATIIIVILIYILHIKLLNFQKSGLILFLLSDLMLLVALITGILIVSKKASYYQLKIIHRITSWLTLLFIPIIWLYCH